jgi:uncharacterized membrane protein
MTEGPPLLSTPTSNKERALSQLVEAILLLFCEGAAVTWLCAFLGSDGLDFVSKNSWPTLARNSLLGALALIWLMTLGGILWLYFRDSVAWAARLGRVLLPLVPLSLVPGLLVPGYWSSRPLPFLILLTLLGFVAESCFSQSALECSSFFARGVPKPQLPKFVPAVLYRALPLCFVLVASGTYVVVTGLLTVWKHHGFGTGAYDLAIFDNMMWNAMHGSPYHSSIMYNGGPGNSLAGHAEIAMVFFVPFYALYPSSEALLWLQAICLGAGAIPLFLLARVFLRAGYAVAIALLYLLYAPLHGSQFYDYHWLTIIPPFLFLNFFALATHRTKLAVLSTVLLWLLREDVAPGLLVLGLVLAVSGYRVKQGLWLALSSGAWFVLVKFVIMPSLGTWFFADLYAELATPTEKGYASVIKTLVTNPWFVVQKLLTANKLEYALHIVAPVALLPLRRFGLAVLLLPGAFFTIFTNWSAAHSIAFQYSAHYTAYIFAAVAVYLAQVGSNPRRLGALLALLLTMICHSTNFGVLLRPSSFVGGSALEILEKRDAEAERLRGLHLLRAQIPKDASVIATTRDSSHLSARTHIYAFGHSRVHAEYALIHPQSFGMGPTNQDIWAVLGGGEYGLLAEEGQTTLWKRGHASERTGAALKALRRQVGGGK